MRIVSGIRSSGQLTIANYLGAISQFIKLQENHECFYFIADLHAITTPYDPKTFSGNVLDVAATYLASGLDPTRTTMFLQSLIPEHTQLQWLLATITPMGELERMTQYKEKTRQGNSADVGLFMYPVLMAADILLYKPQAVPVGDDQVQHVEITRVIAERFNKRFGNTFPLPQPKTLDATFARIKSLQDPSKKMSKSDTNHRASVGILDTPDEIKAKMKAAVTDSGKNILFDLDAKPAIANLLTIASGFSGITIPKLEQQFKGVSYAEFKMAVAEMLIEKLRPLQKKYAEFMADEKRLKEIIADGSNRAHKIASRTFNEVQEKMGLKL
jgi:tryptophanyl-tRNA synthetase